MATVQRSLGTRLFPSNFHARNRTWAPCSTLDSAAHRWHHCVRGRRIKIGRSPPAFVLGTVRSSDGATVCAEGGDSQRSFSVYFKAYEDCAVRIEAFTAFAAFSEFSSHLLRAEHRLRVAPSRRQVPAARVDERGGQRGLRHYPSP